MTKKKTMTQTNVKAIFCNGVIPTPLQIKQYLDQRVIGQEEAKRSLAIAVYNHYKRVVATQLGLGMAGEYGDVEIEKSNIIMMGGTGSGKTFLVKTIAKMLGVPCHIHDCTKLTEAGYSGEDVEVVLNGLRDAANNDIGLAQVGIVCLDEIDKLATRQTSSRDVGGQGVQQALLKIVEGDMVTVPIDGGNKRGASPLVQMDTSNILFIGMGAFCGMESIVSRRLAQGPSLGFQLSQGATDEAETDDTLLDEVSQEDLVTFGMMPELMGRFPVITHTNMLQKEDLVRILSEPRNAITKQFQKLFYLDGRELVFEEGALEVMAEAAMVSNTGARGLRGILEKVLKNYMFEAYGKSTGPITIDKAYAEMVLGRLLKRNNQ